MAVTDPADTHGHTILDAINQQPLLRLDNDDGTVLDVTGVAATDVFTTDDDHGFVVGDKVQFSALTGGDGAAIDTTYYVKTIPSATTFTLSADRNLTTTLDITTAVTAGTIRAEYVLAQTVAEVNAQIANAAG